MLRPNENRSNAELRELRSFLSSHLLLKLADEEKTRLIELGASFKFLGFTIKPSYTDQRVRLQVPPAGIQKAANRVDHLLSRARWLSWSKDKLLAEVLASLKGWQAYFLPADNLKAACEELIAHLQSLFRRHHRYLNAEILHTLSDKAAWAVGRVSAEAAPPPSLS